MQNPNNSGTPRRAGRWLALGMAVAAVVATCVPRTQALPQCGYLIYWYSSATLTTVVGSRVVDGEECGCAAFETGQRTAYRTISPLACSDPMPY